MSTICSRAEAFAGAGDAGEDLLRRDRRIGQAFHFVQTNVTRLAVRLRILLAKIFGQFAVAAVDAGANAAHLIEQLARGGDNLRGAIRVSGAFFNQRFPAQHVGGGVEQDALGFQTVPACAAGFLLVMLDGFRHGGVNDAAHVAAIDTHAEGDGGGNDVDRFRGEIVLGAAALVGFHAGMIECGINSIGL